MDAMIGVVKLNIIAWDSGNLWMLEIKSYWLTINEVPYKATNKQLQGHLKEGMQHQPSNEKKIQTKTNINKILQITTTYPSTHMSLATKKKKKENGIPIV